MKSKDDKSEDGSDQERECLEKNEQTRILHVLCMFRSVYIIYCGFLRDNFFFLILVVFLSHYICIFIYILYYLDHMFELTISTFYVCLDTPHCNDISIFVLFFS